MLFPGPNLAKLYHLYEEISKGAQWAPRLRPGVAHYFTSVDQKASGDLPQGRADKERQEGVGRRDLTEKRIFQRSKEREETTTGDKTSYNLPNILQHCHWLVVVMYKRRFELRNQRSIHNK